MLKWLSKLKPAVLFAFCFLIVLEHSQAYSAPDVSYEISDVKVTLVDNSLTYTIFGSSVPVYTVSERFSPFRVVVDIASGSYGKDFNSSLAKLPENRFAELTTTEVKTQTPSVLRYEFKLADSHDYSVNVQGNNLEIKLVPANSKNSSLPKDGKKSDPLTLKDFIVNSTPNKTTITIVSSGSLEHYTVDTAPATNDTPARMFIDFKGIKADELVKEKQIGTSVSKIRVTSSKDKNVRIYFDSANKQLFKYAVAPTEQGLNVVIDETTPVQKDGGKNQETDKKGAGDTTLDALIGSSRHSVTSGAEKAVKSNASAKATALENDFAFSGYNKQRISVDFYKIDIHNVFRLFKQITDLNIIVDEEVQGTLTLALNDVPWDFALDIILNLMDLKKEERFNTVVIYPSKKAFVWPNRAEDNLAIKADVQVIEQEALVIEKSATQSKEVTEAKDLIGKAKVFEKDQYLEEAAEIYEKAIKLWPQNTNLSNHLTTLYLVSLGQNAKALYLAKQTLKHDSKNFRAALYAAIASANMQKIAEASEFFNQSVSGTPPMKEALISYAAFSENNGQNDAALKLLEKFQKSHGESIESMLAKARIFDKLGRSKDASQQYKVILSSGFELRPDMKKFIEGRLAAKDLQ